MGTLPEKKDFIPKAKFSGCSFRQILNLKVLHLNGNMSSMLSNKICSIHGKRRPSCLG